MHSCACCKLRSCVACCAVLKWTEKALHLDFIDAAAGTITPVCAHMQWPAVLSKVMT